MKSDLKCCLEQSRAGSAWKVKQSSTTAEFRPVLLSYGAVRDPERQDLLKNTMRRDEGGFMGYFDLFHRLAFVMYSMRLAST